MVLVLSVPCLPKEALVESVLTVFGGGDCALVGNTPVTLCTRCFIRFGVDSFPGGKHRNCASIWFNPFLVGFVIISVHFV